jgi:hypothetical protein
MATEPPHSSSPRTSAAPRRSARGKARIRAIVAVALIALWSLSALTGFVLYAAPTGPRSGWLEVLLLTKREWGDAHFWVSVAAAVVTVVHLAIDRKALKSVFRFLVSTERGRAPHE